MKLTKAIISILACLTVPLFASAETATPKKLGPVSYYGALHTSGGKIVGAKNNQEAVIRGLSLYWSDEKGLPYYDKKVIGWAVDNLHIDVFRFAMGITYYDDDGGTKEAIDKSYSYSGSPENYLGIIDQMVEAAIENDIYIILDWHSHRADSEQSIAKVFFKAVAQKYKDVPNVIYEIFSEPVSQSWDQIKSYANAVIPGIRTYTENLVLVGTPNWSLMTTYGGVSGTNVGYVLHFHAGTHSASTYGGRATQAKSSGNPVFITEWSTVNADGAGNPSSGSTQEWMSFMEENRISNCNWSLHHSNDNSETSAMFESDKPLNTIDKLNSATYSTSGKLVRDYLEKNARSWGDSLVKGKNTGPCAFKTTSVKETDDQVTGVFKSGCTYISSNENVVSSTGEIMGPGFSFMTGNDNSQSVIIVSEVPKQTIPGLVDLTCNYNGDCSKDKSTFYSKGQNKEWIVSGESTTEEGASFSLTSLNPDVVTVKTATCSDGACPREYKGRQVVMYEFKDYGTAQIVATAPAVAGYPALNKIVTVTFNKGINKIHSNFGKGAKNGTLTLDFGASVAKFFPDTAIYEKAKVTYTFNGKESSPYITRDGDNLIAGNQNAIVDIKATADETVNFSEFSRSVTVIVGDVSQAVNIDEWNCAQNETHCPISSSSEPESSSSSISTAPESSSSSVSTKPQSSSSSVAAETQSSSSSAVANPQISSSSPAKPTSIVGTPLVRFFKASISGKTLLFASQNAGHITVDVYSPLGSLLKQFSSQYDAGYHSIDLTGFNKGTYILVIRQNKQKEILPWVNK